MFADTMHGSGNDCQNGRLHSEEHCPEPGRRAGQFRVCPCGNQHESEAGEHKTQPCEQPAKPSASHNPQVHAEFVGLGSRQHLHHGEQPVEAATFDPTLLIHQLAADHGDLRNRTPKCENSKSQKTQKECGERKMRRVCFTANRAGRSRSLR